MGRERKGQDWKGRDRKGMDGKGRDRKGEEWTGGERKGMERKAIDMRKQKKLERLKVLLHEWK
jgi:hypothetical protein